MVKEGVPKPETEYFVTIDLAVCHISLFLKLYFLYLAKYISQMMMLMGGSHGQSGCA